MRLADGSFRHAWFRFDCCARLPLGADLFNSIDAQRLLNRSVFAERDCSHHSEAAPGAITLLAALSQQNSGMA
jgi:hypothetical protein